jgi:hypothetical protein
MKGHFTFKYIEGPNKDQTFDAIVDEFELRLPEGQTLVNTPDSILNL